MSSELNDSIQTNSGPRGWRTAVTDLRVIVFILLISIGLWMISLPRIELDAMEDMGLVTVLPSTAFVSLFLLVVGFVASVFRRGLSDWVWRSYVIAFITFLHGTPALLYGTMRYPWGWKHVGVVDYIQRFGTVNPDVPNLAVYHNWPGFFGLNALLTEAAGLDSALSYASWATLFFNLATLVVLLVIVRALTDDRRVAAFAVWFYFLAAWVGQDYFSPQSLTFVFYLTVLAIVLRWYRSAPFQTRSFPRGYSLSQRVRRLRNGWFESLARGPLWRFPLVDETERVDKDSPPLTAQQRWALAFTLLLLMFAIASSHQLSPLMTMLALLALTIFGLARPWSLPLPMVAATMVWGVSAAASYVRSNLDELAESGRVVSNVQGTLIDLDRVSQGQVIVSWMARGLTAWIMVLAFAGIVRAYRRGTWHPAAVTLMLAPALLVLQGSYGTELLFRIFMFALPFSAFLAALLLFPDADAGSRWPTRLAAAAMSLTLMVGFLFAYYGNEHLNYFTPAEVEAADYLYTTAPQGSLIVEGSRFYPGLSRNHEFFTYVPIAREPWETRIDLSTDPVPRLTRWLTDDEYPAAYLIITRSQKVQTESEGQMPAGGLASIETALLESPEFEVWFANEDATIFVAAGQEAGP